MLSYSARVEFCQTPLAKNFLQLMDAKKTNLALSADVTLSHDLIAMAELLGDEICMLKTHIDVLEDFTPTITSKLKALAKKHQFLLFEDRKFADIGNTVKMQYAKGIYRIADWADVVNAHSLPGPGIIQALEEAGLNQQRGLILLAEMSSYGHLMDASYQQKTLALATQFSKFVIGFITQHALTLDPQWINFTPGIQISGKEDSFGQQYTSPETAILKNGTDVIIVGRGIIQHAQPLQQARLYRQIAWDCYTQRCLSSV